MKAFRKLVLSVLAVLVVGPLVGCGVGTTQEENNRTIARVIDYDARMMVDDLLLFSQLDRPLRTSRWIID
jgi:hypothetical protein